MPDHIAPPDRTTAPTAPAPDQPTASTAPSSAAFFDVDNTLLMGASMFHFARGLAQRRFFTARDMGAFALQQVSFRIAGRESAAGIRRARESALAFVAGKPVEQLVALCEEIYDESLADRIWPGTLALARAHLDAGREVWLVTATPIELAGILARRLGFTGALGTRAETRDGVYTGHLVGDVLHAQAKATAVAALAAERNLDLSRSSAYSDSVNDLPLLRSVGDPHAVNPDSALLLDAREAGWAVHEFRTGRAAAAAALRIAAAGAAGLCAAGALAAAAVGARRLAVRRMRSRLPAGWPGLSPTRSRGGRAGRSGNRRWPCGPDRPAPAQSAGRRLRPRRGCR
ncbi:MAG: HAD-superfamily subfamily hydrolase [Jatrophihabitantaceae bacterium]|nr:HAD-superfamily subfamily hydrolase [Jatrophihabitantaceae bacterium]